ncbi:MAG TPA: TonB family protein [Thermoanaerobaculia bacterium]|jgi:protein TonB
MQDRVTDVLTQRAALDRGAGTAIAISLLLHGGLTALAVYAATHSIAPKPATSVQIQFAPMQPAQSAPAARRTPAPKLEEPQPAKVEEPKAKIEEPKPAVPPPQKPPEKNAVPFSPFGRSTKKGTENAEPKAAPPVQAPATGTAPPAGPEVPVGGAGVTGLEGGDFPYTLYIEGMQRKIGSNWFRPAIATGTPVIVYFRIQRDGTISEARVETSSGNGTVDRAALSAVRSSTPLNPLPFNYNGTYLGVRLTFR